MTQFISTRDHANRVSGHEAIIQGLARDGGLFTPEEISFTVDPASLAGKTYQETAEIILSAFFNDYTQEEIHNCVISAYDSKFDDPAVVPLRKTQEGWLMDLWHGPTSAFKDLALTILPHLLTAAYRRENRTDTVAILTATSGDTGKAALSGFQDVPNTAVTVFYPTIGVSAVQKRQMQTSAGKNVDVISVNGNFDDCQRMVKEAVSSKQVLDACRNVVISSANSINIGRLVPQVVYYYASYIRLADQGEIQMGDPVSFVVPTGNFGDILAGYLAKRIGLPVRKLICASNRNHILTDFINTGIYDIRERPFYTTMSPSMDILISSNLERLLFMLSGNDDKLTSRLMQDLKEKKIYEVPDSLLKKLQESFTAFWSDEADCAEVIRSLYASENILIDPHTAVAYHAMKEYKKNGNTEPCIVLSTASPYKFGRDVLQSVNGSAPADDFDCMEALHALTGVPVPENLASLKDLPVRFTRAIDTADGLRVIAERMEEISNAGH